MKFYNETLHPAALFRNELAPGRMYMAVLTRVRHRIHPDGSLTDVTPDEGPLDVRRQLLEDEFGQWGLDQFYPRTGTDLIVVGDVVPESPRATEQTVFLRVGPYALELKVFGDRCWERLLGVGPLRASAPERLRAFALTWARAFGGEAAGPYGPLPYPANPTGRGYFLDAGEAAGKLLPNIEDPSALVQSWEDRPAPVGFGPYPAGWGLRHEQLITWKEEDPEHSVRIHPDRGLFDGAHPRLSGKRLEPGMRLTLTGMSEEEALVLRLPPEPSRATVTIGERTQTLEPVLDEVLLCTRTRTLETAWRTMFHFTLRRGERRSLVLAPVQPEEV